MNPDIMARSSHDLYCTLAEWACLQPDSQASAGHADNAHPADAAVELAGEEEILICLNMGVLTVYLFILGIRNAHENASLHIHP